MKTAAFMLAQHAQPIRAIVVGLFVIFVSACATVSDGLRTVADSLGGTKTGGGDAAVSGSVGESGAQGESKQLAKCQAPVATVALAEDQRGYAVLVQHGLPQSPMPLLRLMLQQSGCFRVVDRAAGLRATEREMQLAQSGMLRKENQVKKGKVLEARYTLTPHVVFSEQNAGGVGAVIGTLIPFAGLVAGSIRFKEAQVVIFLTDNNTTEQVAAAEGRATANDIGIGGLVLGGTSAGLGGAWGNTNEGKVVAAAFLDAINKLLPHVKTARRS